ncbi:MAG: transcription elongation factor GreA [Parcubacteria group bacterium]|nr:transcription elongation factor GreA [Parcubacteria group bacterium]
MPEEKNYLTKDKYEEFKKELDNLKHVRRKEVAESLEYAKSLGDLSENAEYHEARDMQAVVEDRIFRLETILKSAIIVSSSNGSNTIVVVGSVVTVEKESDGKSQTYTIVGSEEADTGSGKISVRSPFGSAVVGKSKNETFTFTTPTGKIKYKVIDIK